MASKFDSMVDEIIFIGYFLSSKAYRVYNKRVLNVEESINIKFYKSDDSSNEKDEFEPTVCKDLNKRETSREKEKTVDST